MWDEDGHEARACEGRERGDSAEASALGGGVTGRGGGGLGREWEACWIWGPGQHSPLKHLCWATNAAPRQHPRSVLGSCSPMYQMTQYQKLQDSGRLSPAAL